MPETSDSPLQYIKKYALRVYFTMPLIVLVFDRTLGISYTVGHHSPMLKEEYNEIAYGVNQLPPDYSYDEHGNGVTKLPSIETVLTNGYRKSIFIYPPKAPTGLRAVIK